MEQTAHHGPSWDAEPFSELVVRPAVQVLQHDELPVVDGEAIEGDPKVVQVLDWSGCRGRRVDRLAVDRAIPGARPLLVAPVAEEDVEPRVELARFVETAQIPEGVQERVLRRVCRVRVVAGERPGVCQRATLILMDQVAKCLGIALTTSLDRVGILHDSLPLLSGGTEKYSVASLHQRENGC